MKVAIVGTIDETHQEVSGQYDRTEIIKEGLIANGYDIVFINMIHWKSNPVSVFIRIIVSYFKCDSFIFLASLNGTMLILSILNVLLRIKKKKTFQIAIGGSSNSEFVSEHKWFREILMRLDAIFVEIESMKEDYARVGLNNVIYLPNCKTLHLDEDKNCPSLCSPYHFCTYSRVTPTKGITEAVNTVKFLNSKYGDNYCTLDIYGTYLENDREWFENLMSDTPSYIKYKSRINRTESINILSRYDLMLFYTTHVGEGIPGGLIDCYEAGLPIVACNTSYMNNIVKDGITGFVFENTGEKAMIEKVVIYTEVMDPESKKKMRDNCLLEAKKYDTETVIQTLSSFLS